MIDPIQPVTLNLAAPFLRPGSGQDMRDASPEPAPATAANNDARSNAPAAIPAASRDPISLSVERDAGGTFVYTLTDTASGQILAVIPRSVVTSPSKGLEVDIQA